MEDSISRHSVEILSRGVGRRRLVQAAIALSAGVGIVGSTVGCRSGNPAKDVQNVSILQPGTGERPGDHYLASEPDEVLWGYLPNVHARPVLQMKSGQTVTIDTLSHEGILEDQGRDPVAYFGGKGIPTDQVLTDAISVAAEYSRTPRNFTTDGPHVVTGPIFVEGAQPGDVLKIETLEVIPRVPYGVISSRHGKGSLAVNPGGGEPAGITMNEVMPPAHSDKRSTETDPTQFGTVSVLAKIEAGMGVMALSSSNPKPQVRFNLRPFMGLMGVAYSQAESPTAPAANSVPPMLGGGNLDIRLLGAGSTLYVPVFAEGALFYAGDPHHAQGDGEVALTAMEGSLRATFRLTVCKKGSNDAPSVAYSYPFGETADSWIPIGLSDPDGLTDGVNSDLDVAMRRAVVNALDFLQNDRGMDRALAYAYLSAAADFIISQVVDRTVGVHAQIFKANFD